MTGPPSDRIPDGITPLVGYRAWQVVGGGGRPRLLSALASIAGVGRRPAWILSRGARSTTRRLNASRFHPGWIDGVAHEARESCSCRFYAMKELHPHLVQLVAFARRAELTPRSQGTFVLGRVELAGKVIEHARG